MKSRQAAGTLELQEYADVSDKPVIFISYSHRDRAWLDYVRSFFEPFAEHWNLQIWDDTTLRIGDDWKGDIYSAIDAACVFVLLVSRYALSSTFILNDEAARAWGRARSDIQFCPLVVTPYHAPSRPWLDQPNRRPRDGKALSELSDAERDREMATVAKHVDEIVASMAGRVIAKLAPAPERSATRPPFPSIVDYGRLPETPYKKLVGREIELKQLDGAWADQKTRIISLIAWGGAGKTSLVVEWLTRVRNDAYRGADAVLCWSFYSQGTQGRAAAGEGLLDWALGKLKIKIDTTSATAKGERLAEELSRRRVLLVLDGFEPLQFSAEGQEGALKEQGLRAFLRALAIKQPEAGHSLIVITSRLPVRDLAKWEDSTAPKIDLWRLSDEAGAALLEEAGVKGTFDQLRAAAHDFAGHALALSLLAGFLLLLHQRDVLARSSIRPVLDEESGHDQARRVIEAFDNEWLAHEPVLRAIMFTIGLFDRPAQRGWIEALRAKPVIEGLTDAVLDVDEGGWRAAIEQLREVRLLDSEDSLSPDALDAHPLVREWFGDRFKVTNETAWREAHGRLYEHLRDSTKEGAAPVLADLAPLYQAIMHGCCAGRQQEALDHVYTQRISRLRRTDGRPEFYAVRQLGATGSELAAVAWFFQNSWMAPTSLVSPSDQSFLLNVASYCLRAQGRYAEALPAMRASLRMSEDLGNWQNASIDADNISELELLSGNISEALALVERSASYAQRSGIKTELIQTRTLLGLELLAAGKKLEAERAFTSAEWHQRKIQPHFPLLYGVAGYRYCELLLAKGAWATVLDRGQRVYQFEAQTDSATLLDRAMRLLWVGRAHLGFSLEDISLGRSAGATRHRIQNGNISMRQAIDRLRAAAQVDYLPFGLLAISALRRSIGDWSKEERDLNEVEEIAEPGPMRLYLCDVALERARLAFAQIEAFAPLNGMLEKDNPPKPEVPSAEEITKLKAEAEKQIKIADDYIQTCGYHRRDEELAELQEVLRGEKTFASLPPRV